MAGPTAAEVAASLPPLTDEQLRQIATLLGIVQSLAKSEEG